MKGSENILQMKQGQPAANPEFKYTDKEYEEDLDAFYFQARYYDPVAGRFWGRDRVVPEIAKLNQFQMNPYQFNKNNPVSYTDKDGHLSERKTIDENTFRYDFSPGDILKTHSFAGDRTGKNLRSTASNAVLFLNGVHFSGANWKIVGDADGPGFKKILGSNFSNPSAKQRAGFVSGFYANGSIEIGPRSSMINKIAGGEDNYFAMMSGGFQVVFDGMAVQNISQIPGQTPGSHLENITWRWSLNTNNAGEAFILVSKTNALGMAKLALNQGAVQSLMFDGGRGFYMNDSKLGAEMRGSGSGWDPSPSGIGIYESH
jgi:RHS repeat-associated protein